jgi:hypothetical protein
MNNIKVTSKYCKECNKQKRFERSTYKFGMGDLIMMCAMPFIVGIGTENISIIIASSAFWPIGQYILYSLSNPWRCKDCGGKK